jgi:hypothetical protein
MQATRDAANGAPRSPNLEPKVSRVPEYLYQAAILAAVLLLLWTAA